MEKVGIREVGASILVVDVGELVAPDAGTVDALARLMLSARRCGLEFKLTKVSERLAELIELAGLTRTRRARFTQRG